MVARKSGSPEKVETSKKAQLVEQVADVAVLEAVPVDAENVTTISAIPVFEEISPSDCEFTLVKKKIATTVIVGQDVKNTVVDVMTVVSSKNVKFRREAWEHSLVVRAEKKTRSVIIRDNPKRYVKAFFKPVVFDSSFMYLMDSCYKKFYDQLQRVARETYPPEPSAEQNTLYPILPSTVIKVVPDLQPPNYVEINHEKLKLKVVPEPVLDDMSSEQIAEAVRVIDEACEEQRSVSSICVYQDPGSSKTKATTDEPQGGILRKGQYHPLLIGDLECSYLFLKNILRNRPLWEFEGVREVMPWVGRTCYRLPEPVDLDIPDQVLNIQPPLFQVIEPTDPNDEAYSTTIAVAVQQSVTINEDKAIIVCEEQSTVAEQPLVVVTAPPPTTESSTQAAPPSLEQLVLQLAKDMKKMNKKMKKMEKMMKKEKPQPDK